MDFTARIRLVLGIIGFVLVLFLVKEVLALNFDPVVYRLKIEGLSYLNPSYLRLKVMPIGGVRLSKLKVPSDPFIRSYTLKYMGNGTAILDVKERKVACIVYVNGEYMLASKDGYFLLKLPSSKLYEATGYKIFFDVGELNFNETRIINPSILKSMNSVFSYPTWFERELVEVDLMKKTLYFVKGVSVRVQKFDLDEDTQKIISKLVDSSPIGSRYLQIERNFVHLPNS